MKVNAFNASMINSTHKMLIVFMFVEMDIIPMNWPNNVSVIAPLAHTLSSPMPHVWSVRLLVTPVSVKLIVCRARKDIS